MNIPEKSTDYTAGHDAGYTAGLLAAAALIRAAYPDYLFRGVALEVAMVAANMIERRAAKEGV